MYGYKWESYKNYERLYHKSIFENWDSDYYEYYTDIYHKINRFILSKGVIEKYLTLKYSNIVNLHEKIKQLFEQGNKVFIKIFIFIEKKLYEIEQKGDIEKIYYNEIDKKIQELFTSMPFSTEDIEKIDIAAYSKNADEDE